MIERSSHWPLMIFFVSTQQTETPSLAMPSIIYALVLKFHSERRYKKLEGLFLMYICSPFTFLSATISCERNLKQILLRILESSPASTMFIAPAYCKFVAIIFRFPSIYTFASEVGLIGTIERRCISPF